MIIKYKVPFEIDPEMIGMFEEMQEETNVYFEASHTPDSVWVVGTLDHLADFFQELDGPAQSFSMNEFKEWAEIYKVDDDGNSEEAAREMDKEADDYSPEGEWF